MASRRKKPQGFGSIEVDSGVFDEAAWEALRKVKADPHCECVFEDLSIPLAIYMSRISGKVHVMAAEGNEALVREIMAMYDQSVKEVLG